MMARGQYEAFARLLPELYSAQTLETLPRHIIDLIPRLIRADSYAYNETNFARRRFEVFMRPAPEEVGITDLDATLARLMHQHPMVQHNRNTDQRALKLSELVSQRQFRQLELYDSVYRPARIEHLMTGGFKLSAAADIVTLGFGRQVRDFGEGEAEVLNLMRPHLRQAYRNADAMTAFQRQLESREQSLEGTANMAVVVVDNLTIRNASPLARRWLATYFPGRDGARSNDQLPDLIARWLRYWQAAFNRKHFDVRPRAPLTVESPDGQLNVRLMETRGEQSMLLLTREPGGDHPELLERLGLTRRESEVLLWISRGKTSREVAAILSITPKTVDKHVEHIQHKLCAENRTIAAAIAWAALRNS
jgi:DNA-binding CsgD family transcriptional regulator